MNFANTTCTTMTESICAGAAMTVCTTASYLETAAVTLTQLPKVLALAAYDWVLVLATAICQWFLVVPASIFLLVVNILVGLWEVLLTMGSSVTASLNFVFGLCFSWFLLAFNWCSYFVWLVRDNLVSIAKEIIGAGVVGLAGFWNQIHLLANTTIFFAASLAQGFLSQLTSFVEGSWMALHLIFASVIGLTQAMAAAFVSLVQQVISVVAGAASSLIAAAASAFFAAFWTCVTILEGAIHGTTSFLVSSSTWAIHLCCAMGMRSNEIASMIIQSAISSSISVCSAASTFFSWLLGSFTDFLLSKYILALTVIVVWVLALFVLNYLSSFQDREETELQGHFRTGVLGSMKLRELRGLDDGRNPLAKAVSAVHHNQLPDLSNPDVREMAIFFKNQHKMHHSGQVSHTSADSYRRTRRAPVGQLLSNPSSPGSSISG